MHKRFHLGDLEALRAELASLGVSLPISEDVSVLGAPLAIGRLTAPNRLLVQPMEGFDSAPDGSPGPLSFRRYTRFAEGGSGTIWFEATAVLHEARSNPHQLVLHAGSVNEFRRLVAATRRAAREAFGHEIIALVQLTHSGRYSKPDGIPRPMIAHRSPVLDPKHRLPPDYPLVSDDYLDRLQDVYVEAARLASEAGFDGVDVKACHRYLVSELLASHTREGKYGESLENRWRFLRETVAKIRDRLPDLLVTTRINVFDAIPYPYGFGVSRDEPMRPDLTEPLEVVRGLRDLGMVLVNVTVGNPYYNPHFGRPYDRPIAGVGVPDEHPLEGVARLAELTRAMQQGLPGLPVVATGYSWLRHLMPYVAAGLVEQGWAALVGQGRMAFAYPDAARDILRTGRMDPAKTCITCSGCSQIMRDGTMTGCVVRDRDIYAEQYKLGRRYAIDRLQEAARRCQDCAFPTCSANCPARVDVPAFVRAFAEGRIQEAYDVLRRTNALPELCARVCPSEVQCEGGCVEKILADHALPIRDIQLAVCRLARQAGMIGVRLPPEPTGFRIAVVGGGPAGLACAIRLLEHGHQVVIFEQSERLGGTPESLIPCDRCDTAAEEIAGILQPAVAAGRIETRLQCALGRDVSLADLRSRHAAVVLALGLGAPQSLGEADGVVDALRFLRDVKRGAIASLGGRVAVLGGGNTAVDAAVAARQLGADVSLVYRRSLAEMPAWPDEQQRLFRSGCHVLVLTQPLAYETDGKGQVVGLRVARTELGPPDGSGRRAPRVIPGTEHVVPVDRVIEALGQGLPPTLRDALEGVERTRYGLVAVRPDSQATSLDGVYAAGDLVNGGTTAVQGIAEGMKAADEIHARLMARARRGPPSRASSAPPPVLEAG